MKVIIGEDEALISKTNKNTVYLNTLNEVVNANGNNSRINQNTSWAQ